MPLGGAQYFAYNMWVVFTFVAVWHDISFTLLAWGWLISLFILPELVAGKVFSAKRVSSLVFLCDVTQMSHETSVDTGGTIDNCVH